MTLDDIDKIFDIMAKEAAEKSDESLLPGAITLIPDVWGRIARPATGMVCSNILLGVRYRGVRTLVSSEYEDKVLNRAEAGERGAPYFDLEPKA